MKRGEIWTVSGSGYAGQPRPAVIVQNDQFAALPSVTVCLFTTNETDAGLFRPRVEASDTNGLRSQSHLMVDKIMTVPKHRLGNRLGRLSLGDIARLDLAIATFLALA